MNKYEVTCLKCKRSDLLTIEEQGHQVLDFGRKAGTNFLSARWRGDETWGFECICGNDNRLAGAEKDKMDILVQGSPMSIARIAESLKIKDSLQFRMAIV